MKNTIIILAAIVVSGCAGNKKALVGTDKDSHGCIGSAGYTWCEAQKKCVRSWEEPCAAGEKVTACYECGELGNITVDYYKGAGASINIKGTRYKLDRAVSADGAQYIGNNVTLWDKGGNARLELFGKDHTCKVVECK